MAGVGVAVTAMGVTQLGGRGVGGPWVRLAMRVWTLAGAGAGTMVMTKGVGVDVGPGVSVGPGVDVGVGVMV